MAVRINMATGEVEGEGVISPGGIGRQEGLGLGLADRVGGTAWPVRPEHVRRLGAGAVAGAVAQHVEAQTVPGVLGELEAALADIRARVGLVSVGLVGGVHEHDGEAGSGADVVLRRLEWLSEVAAGVKRDLAVIEGALGIGAG